jgi:L-ascorbate metabolism protein UlaG (beta-lactamase superfamily)
VANNHEPKPAKDAIAMVLSALGVRAQGERLARMQKSLQWRDGHFDDVVPRGGASVYTYLRRQIGWGAMRDWAFGGSKYRVPTENVPMVSVSQEHFAAAPSTGLRVTWLGHSTSIVEIDGARVLIDPVFADSAGVNALMGQRRFFPLPLTAAEMPELDVVLISHDHYDHLDFPTVRQLVATRASFVCPLGVGAHLEAWGVAPERITELDWWEQARVAGLDFVATPARHYSGRGVFDLEHTLWASFAIIGPDHRVFYSGDTAMFPGLRDIGERLGPFDVTLMEAGGYNRYWADIHLGPEQAVQAHRMLQGRVMMPVHWGLFDLAMHGWTEPVERVLVSANERNVLVATPQLGESFEPLHGGGLPTQRWWPELPWDSAEAAPIISTLPSPAEALDL